MGMNEETKGLTPAQAMLHFEANYFEGLFKNKTAANPEYYRCYRAIEAARNRPITLSRAKGILSKFAPGKYQFTEKIEAL